MGRLFYDSGSSVDGLKQSYALMSGINNNLSILLIPRSATRHTYKSRDMKHYVSKQPRNYIFVKLAL
jgi:hypothetical protein